MLVHNWRAVLTRAWSLRLMALAFVLSAAEFALPFFTDLIPDHLMGALGGLLTAAAFVARLMAQNNMPQTHPLEQLPPAPEAGS